jgi:hypothetical protein
MLARQGHRGNRKIGRNGAFFRGQRAGQSDSHKYANHHQRTKSSPFSNRATRRHRPTKTQTPHGPNHRPATIMDLSWILFGNFIVVHPGERLPHLPEVPLHQALQVPNEQLADRLLHEPRWARNDVGGGGGNRQ